MNVSNLTKIAKNNSYEVVVSKFENYVVISFFGIWDKTAQLDDYLKDINNALQKLSTGFNVVLDLKQYKGSTSEYVNLHLEALNIAIKAGLNKSAVILQDNPMLKITIDYIFNQSGITPTYFNNFSTAVHWLSLYLLKSG
ncbi:MAG: hypothetical protein N2645_22660 [Clostridia bacterium]|nr:hypothetical protein [Clostridia bacterium]